MSDDYLWDGSGAPDDEIVRLEHALGGLRYDGPAPTATPQHPIRRTWPWAAMAAAVLIGVAYLATRPEAAWTYEMVDLATADSATHEVAVGGWIETGEGDRARLDVADIGMLDVLPRSRLQLVRSGADEHRVRLERGAIHAVVTAPPRLFVVETPAADAVDLGCEYTLEVDQEGDGTLAVAAGWVALERSGRAALVPAGAVCAIRAGAGPGTPHVPDAPASWLAALERMDTGRSSAADLNMVLAAARRADTLSLWHLLAQVEGAERERVYARLAELVPPPFGVTRARALTLHPDALEVWFDEIVWGGVD